MTGIIDLVYVDGAPVQKGAVRSYGKNREILVLADATEVANTDLSGQLAVILLSNGRIYTLDTGDTTTSPDGETFLRDVNGLGFDLVIIDGLDGRNGATIFVQSSTPSTDNAGGSLWVKSDSANLDLYQLTGSPLAWTDTGLDLKGTPGTNGTNGSSAFTVVRVAAAANVNLASGLVNGSLIDGITVATGDLVLLPAQTTASQNGIYPVVASGAASRATSFNTYDSMPGCYFSVTEGGTNEDTLWRCTSNKGGTLGTTALNFSEFTSGGGSTRAFYPEDYGCVGDGSPGDAVGMKNCCDAACAAGGEVELAGLGSSYNLDTWIAYTPSSGVLRIRGRGAKLISPSTPVAFFTPKGSFDIQGVYFQDWTSAVSAPVAGTGSIDAAVFKDNVVTGCAGQAFWIERPLSNSAVKDNLFFSNTGGGVIRIGTNDISLQDGWIDNQITGNTIRSTSSASSVSAVGIISYGRNDIITSNTVDGVNNSSTGEGWGIYTKCRTATVQGNRINNIKTASNTDCQGLSLKGSSRSNTSDGVQGYSNTAGGNVVTDVGVAGSRGNGIHVQGEDHQVIGNTVIDCGIACINLDDGRGSSNNQVKGNKCRTVSMSTPSYGILASLSGNNTVIDDNIVNGGFTTGIAVIPDTASLFRTSVRDNNIQAATNGFRFNGFAQTINGLYFIGNTVVASVGVLNSAGGGSLSGLRFEENDLRSATTPFSGTITGRVRNNDGFKTRNSGSNSIPTGAGTTVSHGLSVTPDRALVSCSSSNGLQGGWSSPTSTTITIGHSGGGSATWTWEAWHSMEDA